MEMETGFAGNVVCGLLVIVDLLAMIVIAYRIVYLLSTLRRRKKMDYESKNKIVEFNEWCPKCRHFEEAEIKEPCDTCLTYPTNQDSHKPVKFARK